MGNVKRIDGLLPVAVAAVRLSRRPMDAWQRVPLEKPRDEPLPLYAPLHQPQPSAPRDERDDKPAKPQRGVAIYDM